jgi:hypothetical protein
MGGAIVLVGAGTLFSAAATWKTEPSP